MKGKAKILVAMFFMQFILSAGGTVLSPLLAAIEASMPEVDQTLISMMISLPTLIMIPTNLLSGFLGARMSKKKLFLIGAFLFLAGGLVPLFTDSIVVMLIGRGVLGLGMGFVFPLGFAMLPDYFEGQAQQTASGIFNSGSLVLAIPLALIAGIVGATQWKNALWLYLFALVPVVLVTALIPELKKPAAAQTEKMSVPRPHYSTYTTALSCLIYYIGITVLTLTISYFLATILPLEAVGGIAGLGSAVFSAGGIVASLLYGKLSVVLGRWAGGCAFTLGAVALLLLAIFPSAAMAIAAMLLCGLSIGLTGPVTVMGAMAKSPWSASLTSAICMAGTNLGQFLCPYAVNIFTGIGGTYPFVYLCGGILILLVAIYYWVLAAIPAKKAVEQ